MTRTTLDRQAEGAAGTETAVAVVFPGQGSQRPEMARPWRDEAAFSRWVEADDLLGRDVTRLGVAAGADELREPANCQVALFVHHTVLHETWLAAGGRAALTAGHSLGEYNALVAAGALTFADALRLVDVRARATQAAALEQPGGLLACLGGDADAVLEACRVAGAHVANDNAPGQLVIAGSAEALAAVEQRATDAGSRTIRLDVGAAYHSPHMEPAVAALAEALDAADFRDATIPVVANADAQPHTAAADWPALLRTQLVSPVRWRESVGTIAAAGVTDVVELGASPVLTALVKRTAPSLRRHAMHTPEQLVSL